MRQVAAMSWGAAKEGNGPTLLYNEVLRKITTEEVKAELAANPTGATIQHCSFKNS